MTGFKIWYVLAPLFVFVEFAVGYYSFGCERAKHMYVGQHRAAKNDYYRLVISSDVVVGWSSAVLSIITAFLLIVESRREMLDFAGNFVTFDDLFDRSIAAMILTLILTLCYGLALYAANHLGFYLHQARIQKKCAELAADSTDGIRSCSSVRYVDGNSEEARAKRAAIAESSYDFDADVCIRAFKEGKARLSELDKIQVQRAEELESSRNRLLKACGIEVTD